MDFDDDVHQSALLEGSERHGPNKRFLLDCLLIRNMRDACESDRTDGKMVDITWHVAKDSSNLEM